MANEFIHGTVGTTMTQTEFEAVGLHVINSQATGDLVYASSATQLTRLGIGAADTVFTSNGTIPSWSTTPILNTAVAKGTWTASGTWTIPAVTLGGIVTGGSYAINSLGHIGVGAASSATIAIYHTESLTDQDAYRIGIRSDLKAAFTVTTGAFSKYYVGEYTAPTILATNTQNWTTAYGLRGFASYPTIAAGATGTVTGVACFEAEFSAGAMTVTNLVGYHYVNASGDVAVTNQYGMLIEDLTKGATLDIGVAIAGADTCVLWLSSGADNTDAPNGVMFGVSRDTDLYRSAANVLKTDDLFDAALGFQVAGVPGIDESGSGTINTFTITIVKGIVTAFAKVS